MSAPKNNPVPTRADSIALLNNAIAKINFYKNNPDYYKGIDPETNFKDASVRKKLIDIPIRDKKVDEYLINAITNSAARSKPLTPNELKKLKNTLGITKFGKVPGTNLTSFGDILANKADGYYNPFAPPLYLHPNIAPQGSELYGSSRFEDASEIPYYDPLAVAPWDMLSPAQRKERLKKYGNTGTPIKNDSDNNIEGNAVLGSGRDFRHQPGGVFYSPDPTPPPSKRNNPEIPLMSKRSLGNVNIQAEPIKTKELSYSKNDPARFFMGTSGEWTDSPQIPPKTDGTEWTEKEMQQRGYRKAGVKPAKATINNYKAGGEVNSINSRDNTDTKYTKYQKPTAAKDKSMYFRDVFGDYAGSIALGLSPADTPLDIISTLYNLKNKRYDLVAVNGLGALLPGISGLTLKTAYEDIGNYISNKQKPIKKMSKGGTVKKQFQGNYLDAMGYGLPMFNFGGILKDTGLALGDTVTSVVNKDIIPDSAYSTGVGRDISNVTGGITNAAAPAAAGLLVPGGGALAMQAIQMGSNQFIRPSGKQSDTGRVMNSLDPFLRMGAAAGASAYSSANSSSSSSVPKKEEGGPAEKTLINVEGGELEVDPSGKVIKKFMNKPKHPAFGIDKDGNTMSTIGNIIIPKNMTKQFLARKNDSVFKRTALLNLKYRQSLREQEEAMNSMPIAKHGGRIKKYGGDEGSVVIPPRNDPFHEYSDTEHYNSINHNLHKDLNLNFPYPQPEYNGNQYFPQFASSKLPMNTPDTPDASTASTNTPSDWQQLSGNQKAGYIAGQVGTYLPALYNIGRSIFDKSYQMNPNDYTVDANLKFPELKGEAGRLDMRNAFNASRRSIRNMGSGSPQLQGQIALANRMFESLGKFNEDLENRNKSGRFEASRFNKGIEQSNARTRFDINMFNEQSRANGRNFGSKGVEQVSQILQNNSNNNLMMNYLKSSYPGYNINKYTGQGSYTNTGNNNPIFGGSYNSTASTTVPTTTSGTPPTTAFTTMWLNNLNKFGKFQ